MRVTPRAGRDEVVGVGVAGELLVKVRTAPADGAANVAMLRTIAAAAGVAPSRLQLVRCATSRTKIVSIDGVTDAELRARWPGLLTRAG
ncbi:MAG TPA: DUF167 domain-containing protein [Candidatus Limnocylindrales bacterium]